MRTWSASILAFLFLTHLAACGGAGVPADAGPQGTGVRALAWSGPSEQEAYLKASNTFASSRFGAVMALSGDTLVVGAPWEAGLSTGVNGDQAIRQAGTECGAVYVFVRSAGGWAQQAYLKASNTGRQDAFGWSVAIDEDTIVVGAPHEDSVAVGVNGNQTNDLAADAGAAYVFVRTGSTWTQQAYLKASNAQAGDMFGGSVAVWRNTIVVGALFEDGSVPGVNGNQGDNGASGSGAAYLFARSGTTWTQAAYVKASNPGPADGFGCAVAVWGDTVAVGACFEDSGATGLDGDQNLENAPSAGAAYVFAPGSAGLTQQAYLKASNTGGGADTFATCLALEGDTLVVGAPLEDSAANTVNGNQADNSAPCNGAAYVFVRQTGKWSQQAYLKGSHCGPMAYFGQSVAVWGDTVAVGAPAPEDGVPFPHPRVGTAYAFARNAGIWTQTALFKASNSDQEDDFGYAVALRDGRMVVGAPAEDGPATGVNGSQGDSAATADSGAAYVFR